ncbi:Hint domain-containing protein (plasmid) [Rhodopseudomonas palustris]
MPTYYLTSSATLGTTQPGNSALPGGPFPQKANFSGAASGDTFYMGPTFSGTHTPTVSGIGNLNIVILETSAATRVILIGPNTTGNVVVGPGVSAPNADFSANNYNTAAVNVTLGVGSTIGDVTGNGNYDSVTVSSNATLGVVNFASGGSALNGATADNVQLEELTAGSGNDTAIFGNDATIGATGNGTIDLGPSTNTLTAGSGFDSGNIITGSGTDTITLGDFADTGNISVGAGNNAVTVGASSSTGSISSTGTDSLTLGAGTTVTGNVSLGTGNSTVNLGDGVTTTGTVALGNGTNTVGPIGPDVAADNVTIGSTLGAVNVLTGGTGNDTVTFGDSATFGSSGDGAINLGAGNNTLTAGTDFDSGNITTTTGTDTVNLGSGANIGAVNVGSGSDSVTIGDNSTLSGGYEGGSGVDSINIGQGSEVTGNIHHTGGAGTDFFNVVLGDGVRVDGSVLSDSGTEDWNLQFGDDVDITGSVATQGTGGEFRAGDNLSIGGELNLGELGPPNTGNLIEVGDNATIGGNIDAGQYGDTISFGDNFHSIGDIDLQGGNDSMVVGDNWDLEQTFSAGNGNDSLTFGDIDETQNQFIYGGAGSDTLTLDWSPAEKASFLASKPGWTIDPSGNIRNDLGVIQTNFTYGNLDFEQWESIKVICFAAGTLIETKAGPMAIEDLEAGDLVETADEGYRPLRWIGSRKLRVVDLEANPKLRPIRIRAGAIGRGLPERDLVVSPQHRILVRSKVAQRMFETPEVLVAAKQLLALDGIDIAEDVKEVEYFHMLFDRHQVVFAEGALSESLYTGPEALKSLLPEAVAEIMAIMPELLTLDTDALPVPARKLPSGKLARKLASRHHDNAIPLFG